MNGGQGIYRNAIELLNRMKRSYDNVYKKILEDFLRLRQEIAEYNTFMINQISSIEEKSKKS